MVYTFLNTSKLRMKQLACLARTGQAIEMTTASNRLRLAFISGGIFGQSDLQN